MQDFILVYYIFSIDTVYDIENIHKNSAVYHLDFSDIILYKYQNLEPEFMLKNKLIM